MAFVRIDDRVLQSSSTAGAGPWTVGAAGVDASYFAFNAVMNIGDTTLGCVVEPGVAFATGVLTYSATNQITMTTTFRSNGTFGSGSKELFMGLPASRVLYRDGDQIIDGSLSIGGQIGATGSPHTFGAGGTGATTATIKINGGSGAASGSALTLQRNSVSLWIITEDSVINGGTSADLDIYSSGVGVALNINKTTLAATFGGAGTFSGALAVGGSATITGSLTTSASTMARAGIKLPAGTAPTSPLDGELWNDGSSGKFRIGSVTYSITPGTGLTSAMAVDYATKAEQQAAASAVKTVNPLHQQDHPSAAKAWVYALNTTAIQSGYNVSGVSRTGTGVYIVSFTVPFSANPSCTAIAIDSSASVSAMIGAVSNSSVTIVFRTSSSATAALVDPAGGLMVQCFGAQ